MVTGGWVELVGGLMFEVWKLSIEWVERVQGVNEDDGGEQIQEHARTDNGHLMSDTR